MVRDQEPDPITQNLIRARAGRRRARRTRAMLKVLLVIIDLFMAALAFIIGYSVRQAFPLTPLRALTFVLSPPKMAVGEFPQQATDEEPYMHEVPWLREMIDNDDLLPLFTSDSGDIHKSIGEVMDLANRKKDVERELIQLLGIAAEHGNDDTKGALWIMLILGEIQSMMRGAGA